MRRLTLKIVRASWNTSCGLAVVLSGCGLVDANILDTEIHLQTQTYQGNFGSATGNSVPSIACSAQNNTCQQITTQINNPQVSAVCDAVTSTCDAQANLTLSYTVNLSSDQAFQSSVGQAAIQTVQGIDLAYGLPTNSLNFAIPEVDVYVGPQGAAAITDPGVVMVTKGTIGPFQPMTPFPDGSQHLSVTAGTPAFAQLQSDLMNPKVPFVLLLATSTTNPPIVKAGQPIPAGAIQIDVAPTITVGIPR